VQTNEALAKFQGTSFDRLIANGMTLNLFFVSVRGDLVKVQWRNLA